MKKIVIFLTIVFVVLSCSKNNENPSWLLIQKWELQPTNQTTVVGELTHNFSDAKVYVDNELIGGFELPCKIPVLKSGVSKISIYPVILNNGISATKKVYPFVEPYETNVNLLNSQVVELFPTTRYYENLNFWIEDFEDNFVNIETSPSSSATLVKSNDATIISSTNGNYFGRISLSTTANNWIANTTGQLILPAGKEIYLEIDYHNTSSLTTGLLRYSSTGVLPNPNVRLNKQVPGEVEWKKIYIELREVVSGSTNAEYFEISFDALLEEGVSDTEINLDNIKVVYF